MADRLRFGLIGSGSQGRYLSQALALTGQADLVACADPNEEAGQKAVRECGYETAYADAEEMLGQEELDAVIVATTHDQLQPAAMAAVRAGKHAFVEKPMALTAADGRKLVAEADRAGVKLMVGYTLRFMPERILLKKLLDSGAIGDTCHVIAGQLIGHLGGWLGDSARGGGPLMYVGSHVIDQVLWVVGQSARRVFAEVERPSKEDVEAAASLTIQFEGGVVAQVCTSQKMGGRYGWLDVIGSGGRLRSEWESNVLYIESREFDSYRHPTEIEVPADPYLPPVVAEPIVSVTGIKYVRMWAAEMTDFIGAIREDRPPATTGDDGVRVLEIIDAVFKSGRTGRPVGL